MSAERGEMGKKKNPLVFLDLSIDGDHVERITIEVIPWPSFLKVVIYFPLQSVIISYYHEN